MLHSAADWDSLLDRIQASGDKFIFFVPHDFFYNDYNDFILILDTVI